MKAPEILHIHAQCPRCGKVHSLTIVGNVDSEQVNCSGCRQSLGTVADLRHFNEPPNPNAATESTPR